MELRTYGEASAFLRDNQAALEVEEVRNHLLLGIALRLAQSPTLEGSAPYLAAIVDPSGPAMVALMTPPYKLLLARLRATPAEACELFVQDLVAHNWPVPGVLAESSLAGEFAEAWTRITGQAHRVSVRERAFILTEVRHPKYSPGRLRPATMADVDLVVDWIAAFQNEAMGGVAPEQPRAATERRIADQSHYLWEDGEPVSLAGKTRPTAHGRAIGPVYTPPQRRRKGYASSCVAALSQLILDAGFCFCTLHTDLANPISNHIYQEIGYRPVFDLQNYIFCTAEPDGGAA